MSGFWIAVAGVAAAAFLGGVGSSIGVGTASRTASGVLSEKPDLFGKTFILVVLPSTQGFYGFVIAMMLMNNLGVLGGSIDTAMTISEGLQFLMAALPVGIAGLLSGIHQGLVSSSGVELASKQPEAATRGVIFSVMVETYAILGFVVSLFLLFGLG